MSIRLSLSAIVVSSILVSAGCSILPESEPATLYRLSSPDSASAHSPAMTIPMRLGVATPEAVGPISSNRIVVYPERNIVNVYAGARWYEDAPNMFQTLLISDLQKRQLFSNVASNQLPYDVLLLSELRQFQSDYSTVPPTAYIQLDVQLLDGQHSRPINAKSFTTRAQASSVDISNVVDAFSLASDDLAEQLASWLSEQTRSL